MRVLRSLGLLLVVAGVVLAAAPTLITDPGPAATSFDAIERRIPYGAIAGLGAFLVARTRLKPLLTSLAWLVLWAMIGLLFARVTGLALDGADSGKQWMWVGVEAAIGLVAGGYLWRRGTADSADSPTREPAV